jgi:hypothetical protein
MNKLPNVYHLHFSQELFPTESIVYLVKMLVSQSVHFSKALPGGEKMFMLGLAGFCWPIWKARNRVCFEKKPLRDPSDIFYSACSFI